VNRRLSLLSKRPPGQALAEFAMVATLFFLLLFGIIEMGIVVYRYNTVSAAAREAARYAMVHSPTSQNPATTAQIQQIAINHAPFLSVADVMVTFPSDPTLTTQQDAKVSITYNYTQNVPFMSAVTLNLTSTSQMLVSQ
jgi:Flp pilus assembly protein TadG